MKKSAYIKALVKTELLVWARESAGLSAHETAKKMQVKPERLETWESGEVKPTVKQLRKLANLYKRPLAVFYLPKSPKALQALHDFRCLPNKISKEESTPLRFQIRRARYLQQVALDLYNMLGELPPEFTKTVSSSDNPESIASNLRKILGIDYDKQITWNSDYEALNHWRTALENLGLLVFQATNISLDEMRGFSISKNLLPVIVLNIKDSPKARIFTMLHEFVHIMLRESGLCNLEESSKRLTKENAIEVFCNRVAGATLIPMQRLQNEAIVTARGEKSEWEDWEIRNLALRYRASREVVLRRLLIANYITESFYRKKIMAFHKEYESIKKKVSGFVLPHTIAISSAGKHFVRLVLNSYYQEKITSSDLSDYLDIRLKHVPTIESEIRGLGAKK